MSGNIVTGLFRALLFAAAVFGGAGESQAGDAESLLREEAHPRRYWVVWKHMIRGTNETYDLGVIDPYSKVPQHEPRIPY